MPLALLLAVLLTTGCTDPDPDVTTPAIFTDEAALIAVRDRTDKEPYAAAARDLLRRAGKAFALQPQSVTSVGAMPESGDAHDFFTAPPYQHGKESRDGVVNAKADRADYRAADVLADAVRDLALAYAMTGEARYADKALALIRFWTLDPETRMSPRYTNGQSRIELSVTMPALFYGASVLWDYPGWTGEERGAFEAWVRAFMVSAQTWSRENNFENWRLVALASAAALLQDADVLARAFDRWRALLDGQVAADGSLPHELGRTGSLSYSAYALLAMVEVAEIARHHGIDLYGYASPGGRSLKRVLDFHAPYVLDPARWPHPQTKSYRGANAALYEVAYAATGDPLYLEVVRRYGRPLYEGRVMGPVTLTHGRRL